MQIKVKVYTVDPKERGSTQTHSKPNQGIDQHPLILRAIKRPHSTVHRQLRTEQSYYPVQQYITAAHSS